MTILVIEETASAREIWQVVYKLNTKGFSVETRGDQLKYSVVDLDNARPVNIPKELASEVRTMRGVDSLTVS